VEERVHCLGVLLVDALSRTVTRYPEPRTRPVVITDELRFAPGGGAANAGCALGQMGIGVRVFGRLGGDPNGTFVVDALRASGVDTSCIAVSASEVTSFAYVGVHADGERTFIFTPGTSKSFTLDDLNRDLLLETDFLLYPDLWNLPAIDGRPAADLFAEARARGVVTLLDETWGLGPRPERLEAMLPHTDYVLPSYDDLAAIYPGRAPEAMADHLHALGAGTVVLKLGREGCLVSCDGVRTRLPSCANDIVDTTGAGDCFNAGFIGGLVRGLDAVGSAHVASRAAAACIRHVGGAVGIPRIETLLEGL